MNKDVPKVKPDVTRSFFVSSLKLLGEIVSTLKAKELQHVKIVNDEEKFPTEIAISNLPEVQRVEISNFPEQKETVVNIEAPIVTMNNEELLRELKKLSIILTKDKEPNEAPIININNEELLRELKKIALVLSEKEEESVEKVKLVDEEGNILDLKNTLEELKQILTRSNNFVNVFPAQSQQDLSALAALYTVRVDKTSQGGIIYVGSAPVASNDSDAVWQISKVDTSILSVKWAEGNTNFTNIWDDRLSLTFV